jgi:hypothetical protein
MWNWFNCYLSRRHDYGMWCEPGAIFLRCIHCGKRSSGWIVDQHIHARVTRAPASTPATSTPLARVVRTTSRVLQFRVAAR